ncbi:ABC transporter ATP-binding protein [Peribacillus sp. FSL H8-0477]|uniref:ABC transporter ATP-binding protein n=1 Tax=Peribacillus sp. FSL H8-0477 TaxID=2921388 RepID=UPI0030F722FF
MKNLSKTFNDQVVVNDVSFELEHGRCVALIGPNGAGKTTLLKMLTGLIAYKQGEISFQKEKEWKQDIGFLPQVPYFYEWMTPEEFLRFVGGLSKMDEVLLSQRIEEVLTDTGLTDVRNKKIQGFSGGMKQRLGLAQAILHEPALLFLDEPVSALDPVGRREVMSILSNLKAKTTILYSTHVLHDAEEISDDILLMKNGEIISDGTLEQLLSQTSNVYVVESSSAFPADNNFNLNLLKHNKAEVSFDSIEEKKQFLQWCVDQDINLVSFQENKQTLETLFMEAVKP